jgi:hypothetical protein
MKNGTKWATLAATLMLSLVLLSPAPAQAQVPLADANSRFRVGLNLVPAPFGKLKGSFSGPLGTVSSEFDAAFAFGFHPYVDYIVAPPYFFLGFAPQFLFNVKANSGGGDAARELDLLLRLGAQAPIADRIQLYGYIAPGYSVVTPPRGSDSSGFVLGFHGGAWYDVTAQFFVNAQIGYQFGFQSVSSSVDLGTNYFMFGLGGGVRL